MIIRMRDIRAAGMCSKGAREWFVRNGLDWSAFLKHGVDSEEVLKTGDAMGRHVVEVARGKK